MTSQRIRQVEQACTELAARSEPVTFVTIAARTGIPRVTLYRNAELRAVVEEHRALAAQATTITGLAAQLAAQQLALHALADKVRQHEEQLRKLSQRR
jgi:uncharacterized coiled-coil protein SlyX